jgi:xylan 1,4-beta-xylosidase
MGWDCNHKHGNDTRSEMTTIHNPVLPGFHPDPSILRVGDDYYIATSTFEWFPGVRLHHSRDLVHFRAIGHALTRPAQLDMTGNPRSGGVWAPCLSYADERFYLVYTDVKSWGHGYVDAHNYLVTAARIEGPWSDPIYLNSSGFDPSLFHDDDGRKWLVNMVWDHRPGKNQFAGIVLQELSLSQRRLIGSPQLIFRGTALGCSEGPHLYRRRGYYYLMLAEGGTGYEHAVTLARSKQLHGPYEVAPNHPLLTSRHDPELALQKAGHASLVETQSGELYLAHLCGRPLGSERRCLLGRETALQRVRFDADDWLVLDNNGHTRSPSPSLQVPAPALPQHPFPSESVRDHFDAEEPGPNYQTLRGPADPSWLSLRERPGFLRLRGRESPQSLHRQSLLGRRLQSFRCRVQTQCELEPCSFQQAAGLAMMYDDQCFFQAQVTWDERVGKCLKLLESRRGKLIDLTPEPAALSGRATTLRAELAGPHLQLSFSEDGERFMALGPQLDATQLSDEATSLGLGFTGALAALFAYDLSGARMAADFDYFDYEERDA